MPPRLLATFNRLEEALEEVHAGVLPPARAQAMAAVAGAMIRVLTAGEMEERLRNMEERIEGGQWGA